jgi:hypothetical protein
MIRAVIIAIFVGVVSAFAPVSRVARPSSVVMGFENEIGVQPPLGFWAY